jgi:hypothetical protein
VGLWSHAKHVIRDQSGGVEPIAVGLERNPGAIVELGAENPPDVPLYMLRVGLRAGFGGTPARIPVYRYRNPAPHPLLKEVYHCEVAGKRLEAANVHALRAKVTAQLDAIAPARSLPLCYFRAPRFDYSLPIHEERGRLVCPVLAGPKIRAEALSAIREPVLRHMRTAGYLGAAEDAEVRVVRPSDLRLVPPAAVIRSLDDPGLWLPAVEGFSEGGPVVGLLSHVSELRRTERRRRGPAGPEVPPSGPDVTALLRYIGHELSVRGYLADPWSLYATEVRPEIWARTEELTDPTSLRLDCHLDPDGDRLQAPILHTAAGEAVAALRERAVTVFLAGDHDALTRSMGGYLVEAGFLRSAEDLRAEVVRPAPAEALDPDTIWTDSEPNQEVEAT